MCLLGCGGPIDGTPHTCGQTEGIAPFKLAGARWPDRRWVQATAAITWRLDRVIYTGQTSGAGTIRLADQFRLDQSTSDSRVAFNSAKSFGFFYYNYSTPLINLVLTIRSFDIIRNSKSGSTRWASTMQVKLQHLEKVSDEARF